MSLVRMHNKKTGVTYVYESESYWDKEKQQPRNRRKLIGKIDPATGEIIPTRKRTEPALSAQFDKGASESENPPYADYKGLLASVEDKSRQIGELKARIKELESQLAKKEAMISQIRILVGSPHERYRSP